MALFTIERISSNKQALGDSTREALKKLGEQNGSVHFGKVASAVEILIEAFPYINGVTLVVTVSGNVEPTGFSAVSIAVRTLSDAVMV